MKGMRIIDQPIAMFKGETFAMGTTIAALNVPLGVAEVNVYDPAADFRMQLGPPLDMCCRTADNEKSFNDYTDAAKDRSTSTLVEFNGMDTAANGDYFYLASRYKFAGATVDIATANATASVMTGYYWDGSNWTLVTVTDGTGGATCLSTDGNLTFTVPAGWKPRSLNGKDGLYVLRLQVDAQVDDPTTAYTIGLLPDTTADAPGYFESATVYTFTLDKAQVGTLCSYVASGTGTEYITWMKHNRTDT